MSVTQFGNLLRQFRKTARLTQNELSGLSTVSLRAIGNLERGQAASPRRETVRLLADALRLSGEQCAALQLAAGSGADDAAFDSASSPLPVTTAQPFYGRDRELATVLTRIGPDADQIVTVTGFGGVGKTRLALAAAESWQKKHHAPAVWVQLTERRGPAEHGLRVHQPAPLARWLAGLLTGNNAAPGEAVRLIGERSVLLVLDGNDADQVSMDVLGALTRSCVNVRVIMTARRPAEWTTGCQVPLEPLPVPVGQAPSDGSLQSVGPALSLFLARLRRFVPGFEVTKANIARLTEICSRLDGNPLALESAASWHRLCPLTDLAAIAQLEPNVLASPPAGQASNNWIDDAFSCALSLLSERQLDLLHVLGDWEAPWTLAQAVTRTGWDCSEVAAAIHTFLMRGLIRSVGSDGTTAISFIVLNLVQALLRNTDGRTTADFARSTTEQGRESHVE